MLIAIATFFAGVIVGMLAAILFLDETAFAPRNYDVGGFEEQEEELDEAPAANAQLENA
jgi:MFS superfamily sulfate permease-like transporter